MRSLKEFAGLLNKETIWHGGHNENGNQIICKAGKLTMIYENGSLRHISSGGNEIVRMIYSAVRVKEWITINPVISDEQIVINPDSFKITYKASYIEGEVIFIALYSISGRADSSLTFSFEGEATNDFEKNRIGFCILHPIEGNKGNFCTIIHSDDCAEELKFPDAISPRQPFIDIKSMRWERSGIRNSIDFYGDIFETEDQRNWTDASYKTYCTPLSNPRPVRIKTGQKISQKIVFKADADQAGLIYNEDIKILVNPEKSFPFPRIGIGQSTRIKPITAGEIKVVKNIEFDHYRTDIYLFNDDWKALTERAFREAGLLGFKVELAIFVDDNFSDQINKLIDFTKSELNNLAVIILYHKTAHVVPDKIIEQIIPILNNGLPGVAICCGTNANFVQLNRNRPQSQSIDCISYSIHPQEHASDNLTLVENLQGQSYTIQSAKQFSNNKGIRISPVNIQRRFNANNSNFEKLSDPAKVPSQVDSRLMSLFGGSWIAGSLKFLIEGGASGITILETVGERGIFQGDYDSSWPREFQAIKGMKFPVYFVLKYILSNKKTKVAGSSSTHPLKVDSLAFSEGNTIKIVLLNFTSARQQVQIEPVLKIFSIRTLSAETYPEAISNDDWLERAEVTRVQDADHFSLEPFSITFGEGEYKL